MATNDILQEDETPWVVSVRQEHCPERIATNRPVGVRKSRSTNDQPINKWTYPVGQIKMVGSLPGLVEFRLNFGEYTFTWFHICDSYVHRIEGFASLRYLCSSTAHLKSLHLPSPSHFKAWQATAPSLWHNTCPYTQRHRTDGFSSLLCWRRWMWWMPYMQV